MNEKLLLVMDESGEAPRAVWGVTSGALYDGVSLGRMLLAMGGVVGD